MLESDTSKLASSPKSCQGHRRAYSSSMSLPRPAHADDGSQYRRRSVMTVGHQPSYTNGFFDGGPNQSSRFLLPTRKLVRMFLWALVILLALSSFLLSDRLHSITEVVKGQTSKAFGIHRFKDSTSPRSLLPESQYTNWRWRNDPFPEGFQRVSTIVPGKEDKKERQIEAVVVSGTVENRTHLPEVWNWWPLAPHKDMVRNTTGTQLTAVVGLWEEPLGDDIRIYFPKDMFQRSEDWFPDVQLNSTFAWKGSRRQYHYPSWFWIAPGRHHGQIIVDIGDEFWEDPQARNDNSYSVTLQLAYEGLNVRFHLTMHREEFERRKYAICSHHLYGQQDTDQLLDWREHHRMLGFDMHWAARDAKLGDWVDTVNDLTGGSDTFTWRPAFTNHSDPLWEEWLTIAACYYEYRGQYDFIGLWDTDEWLTPTWPRKDWPTYFDAYMSNLDSDIASLILSDMYIGGKDVGRKFTHEELAELMPTASAEEISVIQQFPITAKNCRNTTKEEGGLQWHKSIHRTNYVETVGVHRYEGKLAEGTRQEWVSDIGTQQGLQLLHSRSQQGFVQNRTDCPIDENVTAWWQEMGRRGVDLRKQLERH